MSDKFTIDTIKDLKIKVKDLNGTLLNYYTKNEFRPNGSFKLSVENSNFPEIEQKVVGEMVSAFERFGKDNEFEAGKILFENLKLSPKQASDIRFWTYHNHYTFYSYIAKRWSDLWKKEITNPSTYIINHWVQSNSSQGELIDYPISGLWWSFYLTVDESREDKYELTKLLFKNFSLRVKQLGAARFAGHKPAIMAVLEFIQENNLENKMEEVTRAVVPYVNLLGGIRPLTYFDKDWFKNKLENRFGEQITKGEKLFMRPTEKNSENKDNNTKKNVFIENPKTEDSIENQENEEIKKDVNNFLSSCDLFGKREANLLIKRYKNTSFEEAHLIYKIVERHLGNNNILDPRSLAARDLLLTELLGDKPITAFEIRKSSSHFKDSKDKILREGDLFNMSEDFQSNKQNDKSNNEQETPNYNHYFCLNSKNGTYKLTSQEEGNWDYCIGLDFDIENQFLIHFYKEGKIKKSKVNGSLPNKTVDRTTPYSNGKNKRLTLCDLKLINQPVLFGIAYKNRYGTFFKAMDEQDVHNFRIDNSALNQEGKKVLYIDEPHQTAFKILPYGLKEKLGSLVQTPVAKGADIQNQYYNRDGRWDALKPYWPELFDGSIEWN